MRRIIIFHISKFGGHSKAAENIKEALTYRNPEVEVLNIDSMSYFYPRGGKIVNFVYAVIIKYFPSLWGKVYDRRKIVKNLTPFKRWVNRFTFRKLSRLIKNFNPVCFIVTQAFPCGVIADFKKKFGLKVPLFAVVTDYYPHRFWIHPFVDKYIVASLEAREILIKEGVNLEKIKILGIPVSIKFLNSCSREDVSRELGFLTNLSSVLIMGGGWGIGPIKKIAKAVDTLDCDFQIIVICGRNRMLYNWFTKNKKNFQKPIFHFGYIDFVYKIMDFSDIIITKGGGITISEALSKGLAIIIAGSIPGQEERNANYLLQRGAAIKVDQPLQVKEGVKMFLKDKKKMYFFKERAKENSFIDSSLKIADLVLAEIDR